jgi:hypothetical protein
MRDTQLQKQVGRRTTLANCLHSGFIRFLAPASTIVMIGWLGFIGRVNTALRSNSVLGLSCSILAFCTDTVIGQEPPFACNMVRHLNTLEKAEFPRPFP